MPRGVYERTPEMNRASSERRRGGKHTAEHRRKNSEGLKRHWSSAEERKQQLSARMKTSWASSERRGEHSSRMREIWEDPDSCFRVPEYREKASEASKRSWRNSDLRRYEQNETTVYKGSGGFHNGVWMRCLNSEGVFADQLDRLGILWIYEPRRFNTSLGSYLPDFFLPEFNTWIEIKGTRPKPKQFEKMAAFRAEFGKCLVVVYQSDLDRMKY